MDSLWDRDALKQLVDLYHRHSILWDVNDPGYKSREARQEAIKSISQQLGKAEAEVKHKIICLRKQFLGEWNRVSKSSMKALEVINNSLQVKSESNNNGCIIDPFSQRQAENQSINETSLTTDLLPGFTSKWWLFDSLIFLQDVIVPRKSRVHNNNSEGASGNVEEDGDCDQIPDHSLSPLAGDTEWMLESNASRRRIYRPCTPPFSSSVPLISRSIQLIQQDPSISSVNENASSASSMNDDYYPPHHKRSRQVQPINSANYVSQNHITESCQASVSQQQQQQQPPQQIEQNHQNSGDHSILLLPQSSSQQTYNQCGSILSSCRPTELINNSSKRDEFQLFAEHIAEELRQIKDPYSYRLAKLKIQTVLFQAQTGEFLPR